MRQHYVLRRMRELNMIDDGQLAEAESQTIVVKRGTPEFGVHAEYFAEMVRQAVYERYKDVAYSRGSASIPRSPRGPGSGVHAVRRGVQEYDRRHGYKGPEGYAELPGKLNEEALEEALQDVADSDDLLAAVVVEANPKSVKAYRRGGETVQIGEEGLRFAAAHARRQGERQPAHPARRHHPYSEGREGALADHPVPTVESALVSVDPPTVPCARWWAGSTSAATSTTTSHRRAAGRVKLQAIRVLRRARKGFYHRDRHQRCSAHFSAAQTGSEPWEPKNYDGKFEGPMRMRTALVKSKNLVSVRILQAIGPQYAQDYITRFGFDPKLHPPYLTMALGAGNATPLQMAQAYSVFANGGYRVMPYFIERSRTAAAMYSLRLSPSVRVNQPNA